ncbi:MAG: hypothetical protein JRL30_11420 [Deltaproteobacteria bacterium]|nr:hypothetical protein [Deltaproteobacteria bacterium]
MKIDPNQKILNGVYPDKTTGPDKPGNHKFSALLREAIDEPSRTSAGSENTQMISSISNIQLEPLFAVQNNPIVERTEKFIGILEEYQKKLRDPQSTLRDIHPLIERMETEKEALVPVLNSLPPGDKLKDILNDILITSSLEVIKFNRGDYVTTGGARVTGTN